MGDSDWVACVTRPVIASRTVASPVNDQGDLIANDAKGGTFCALCVSVVRNQVNELWLGRHEFGHSFPEPGVITGLFG